MRDTIIHGDALDVLKTLPENSVDAIVTDPPSAIGLLGKEWDSNKGGRRQWVAWFSRIMTECLRILKPGGHALVWSLPRTSHWTAWALEDAGFEIRDCISHLFGDGYPKNLDVSKQIDKRGGQDISWFGPWLRQEREKQGISQRELAEHFRTAPERINHGGCVTNWELGYNLPTREQFSKLQEILNLPFEYIEEAKREVVAKGYRVRKESVAPIAGLSDGEYDITIPATEAAKKWNGWGTALRPSAEYWWLCRKPLSESSIAGNVLKWGVGSLNLEATRIAMQGHPAHVLFSHSWLCTEDSCDLSCPISRLEKQNQGAAYYFQQFRSPDELDEPFTYMAKASQGDRSAKGLVRNIHVTCKSTAMMRWLCRLITPPDGMVLDCFCGSGSTLVACVKEGFHFIGIEQQDTEEEPYVTIARERVHFAQGLWGAA